MSKLFRDVEGKVICPQGSVVCIGAFDGLHRGHQALVGRARLRALELGLELVALSFEPLPREYFSQQRPPRMDAQVALHFLRSSREAGWQQRPPRLLLPRAKFEGLCALGVDRVGLLRFNAALAQMSAEDFIEKILLQALSAREVWVGPEFRFGRGRAGDVAMLQRLGAACGFTVCEITPVQIDGERVSSSRLRLQLAAGDIEGAAHALGHRYAIAGKVVRGKQLGRTLGYPTANLRLSGKRPVLNGIYATWVHGIGDQAIASVSSLGTRPTVSGTEPLLEVHLFDFDADVYGKRINVEFVRKLRDEEKFDDLSSMVKQMNIDADNARRALRHDLAETGVSA